MPASAGFGADYELVKDLHTEAGLIDAYDAAVIERRDGGKMKIVKKHETPTRSAGCWAAASAGHRARRGAVPVRRDRRRPAAGNDRGRRLLGAVAGHAAAGMSRSDLKDLGEHLDAGQAGLVVVAVPT